MTADEKQAGYTSCVVPSSSTLSRAIRYLPRFGIWASNTSLHETNLSSVPEMYTLCRAALMSSCHAHVNSRTAQLLCLITKKIDESQHVVSVQ